MSDAAGSASRASGGSSGRLFRTNTLESGRGPAFGMPPTSTDTFTPQLETLPSSADETSIGSDRRLFRTATLESGRGPPASFMSDQVLADGTQADPFTQETAPVSNQVGSIDDATA